MPFVIYSPLKKLYVKQPFGGPKSWVPQLSQASKFRSASSAKNYLTSNLKLSADAIARQQFLIISMNQVEEELAAQAAAEAAAEPPEPHLPPAEAPVKPSAEPLSAEDARELVEELPLLADQLVTAAETVERLALFYQKALKDSDLESIDLLHKIEFSELDPVPGFLLYAQLREVRQRRRVAKDSLELLHAFQEANLADSIKALREQVSHIIQQHTNRTYSPRILSDLFSAFPSVSPETAPVLSLRTAGRPITPEDLLPAGADGPDAAPAAGEAAPDAETPALPETGTAPEPAGTPAESPEAPGASSAGPEAEQPAPEPSEPEAELPEPKPDVPEPPKPEAEPSAPEPEPDEPEPEPEAAPPAVPEPSPAPEAPPRRRRTANARTWSSSALGQRRSHRHTAVKPSRHHRKR